MRAKEFIIENKTYKPFLEQCKEVLYWLKTEFVMLQLKQAVGDDNEMLNKYVGTIIKVIEEALATGKAPAARRIVKAVLPTNQTIRDAQQKARARPKFGGWEESKRRNKWLKTVLFGREVDKKFNFDIRLDNPPQPREKVEAELKRIADLKSAGKGVPWSVESLAKLDLERLNNES